MDDPSSITNPRFQRLLPIAALGSALLHASVAMALLPDLLPQPAHITERAIDVTLDPPAPPTDAPAPAPPPPARDQAARNLTPGSAELQQTAREPDQPNAASAPPPAPPEPDVALTLPSIEPPPTVMARDFGTSASPPAPEPNLEKILPPVKAPPQVSGRDFAMTAPPAAAKSPRISERTQAPPPRQPIREAQPKRAPQQHVADESDSAAWLTPSPVSKAASDYSDRQAQEDYLWQIIRKLSQSRFYQQSPEESTQGVVVARLTIARDGRLLDVSLAKTSGFPNLDRSVMETIRQASPFTPLPAAVTVDSYTFIVPISYRQER